MRSKLILTNARLGFGKVFEQLQATAVEFMAFGGQGQATSGAVEQPNPKIAFQPRQRLSGRGAG